MTELVAVYAASVALGIYLAVAAKQNHKNGLTYTKRRFRAAAEDVTGVSREAVSREAERPAGRPVGIHRTA